jgi:uncharacterized membrane protein
LVEVWGRRGQRRVDKYGGRFCGWVPVFHRNVVVQLSFPLLPLMIFSYGFWRTIQVATILYFEITNLFGVVETVVM